MPDNPIIVGGGWSGVIDPTKEGGIDYTTNTALNQYVVNAPTSTATPPTSYQGHPIPPACIGLTGDSLVQCILRVEAAKDQAREDKADRATGRYEATAGAEGGPLGDFVTMSGGIAGLNFTSVGQHHGDRPGVGAGSNRPSDIVKLAGYKDSKFGMVWEAYLARNARGYRTHVQPLIAEFNAIKTAIAKLEEENSLESKIGRFFQNPLAVLASAAAIYFSGGAAAAGVAKGVLSDSDDINTAITKLKNYRDKELNPKIDYWAAVFPTQYGHDRTDLPYQVIGSKWTRQGWQTNTQKSQVLLQEAGTRPVPRHFKFWLEEAYG